MTLSLQGCDAFTVHNGRKAVLARLTDPESAQFRQMRAGDDMMCGEVNARNRLGGYGGFEPFVVSYGDVMLESDFRPILRANEWPSSATLADDVIGIARYHEVSQSPWPSDTIAPASYEQARNYCAFSSYWADCQGDHQPREFLEACESIRAEIPSPLRRRPGTNSGSIPKPPRSQI
jgi:hypothetical protein